MNRSLTPPVIVIHPDPREPVTFRLPSIQISSKHNCNSLFDQTNITEKDSTLDTDEKPKGSQKNAKGRSFAIFASGLCRCFKNKKSKKVIATETGPETKYEY
mmetsp:Transcript_30390/g.30041  ORF Transcript_30390/g.30041 Transcript_30390/m.30041 type:complete len:102 (-) Transcript_30390:37-342(-)